ncbi:50S ribosomal protein L5 [bacterium]|nr:MAG: 50S ribosomal protein L5 [bacterium]
MGRLKQTYSEEIVPAMREKFSYANVMEIPSVSKIVVNMGVGKAIESSSNLDNAVKDMAAITGQKPQVTRAKKSISNFKLREGMPIGCRVTLRGERMYEFLDRLINVALPRVRDFRGVSSKMSGRGDYNLGLREQFIFPEIEFDKIDNVRGMNITVVTTAKTDEEGRELLKQFGMPFRGQA